MTAQELKNSILQLAVQGKLVSQDKNDEPASELLKRIQAEKAQLIKEGKIKKEKALPPITDEELPFDIPESWEWVRLGDICTIVTGKKDANFGSETGKYNFFTCAKEPIKCDSYSFSGESLLLAGNGDISNISYFEGCFEAYQRTYVLQPFLPKTYLIYLFYHLQYNWLAYNSDKTFGSAIPYIRLGNVQNYLVALPPIEEQQRIVDKIEELLPLVEEYGKAETRLKELNADFPDMLRKSILQQAVQGKLTERNPEDEPASELLKRIQAEKAQLIKDGKLKKEKPLPPITEDEIPFDIPDAWEWVRIDDLYSVSTGMTPLKGEKRFYTNGTIPWITSSLTSNRYIDYAETYITEYALKNTTLEIYPKNTLIIAMYGQGKTRGQISELLIPATINQACAALVAIKTDEISNQFVYFYFQYYYSLLRKKAEGTSQPNLNLGKIRECVFPLPPLEEQKRIVARVEELLALCDQLK